MWTSAVHGVTTGETAMSELTPDQILTTLKQIAADPSASEKLPLAAVRLLHENFEHYDWVGIYHIAGNDLVLGPFLGKPSPHTRIKVGHGICGSAAEQEQTIIVDDVNADPRYLACSLDTKSEIVVPIFKNGKVIGEIDIDSNTPAAFRDDDRRFLEEIAQLLAL
jgi:GAF domain-containing protein